MKIHRSILISSVVVFASSIYEISCGTPAIFSKLDESLTSTNLSANQASGENVVSPPRSGVSLTEKSANETEKRQETLNLGAEEKHQTPKNVTTRKNETQDKIRGLFNDKKNLKLKRQSERVMNSLAGEASTFGAMLLNDVKKDEGGVGGSSKEEAASRQSGKTGKTEKTGGKGVEEGGDGQKKGAIVPAVRSLFEDSGAEDGEGSGNVEKKVKVIMIRMKSLSAGRRETLSTYFDRFLTKLLKKFESRDDAELDEVEDLLDRCLSYRCCSNCCSSCQKRRRRKMKHVSYMVNGSRRKSPRSDDDVSDEKPNRKIGEIGRSSGGRTLAAAAAAATTTTTTTTRTTTTTVEPDTTLITTSNPLQPNKQVQVERLNKLKKRLRKRPVLSRRQMDENGLARKQKCIRQKPASERQQQQRQSDNERTSRPSHRSQFDRDADDFENPIKTRINDDLSDSFEENDS